MRAVSEVNAHRMTNNWVLQSKSRGTCCLIFGRLHVTCLYIQISK